MIFEIRVKEVPLAGIRSPDQLAAFVLKSLGLSNLKDDRDVKILLAFIDHKEGLKVEELQKIANLGQTATYSRIRSFTNAGIVYKAKGSVYRLRERTLADTLDFRVRKDIEQAFSAVVEVAQELESLITKQRKQKSK
ncbi:MAG: hypothetical protein GOV00_03270 [Candidatus Altiarchaeota archaeon]|nr:hypothetical protein [Candidatus Altiarchaeota archaeon]